MPRFVITPSFNQNTIVDLNLTELLGEGANAQVYRIKLSNEYYALKIYTKNEAFEKEKLKYMVRSKPEDLFVKEYNVEYPRYAWPLAVVEDLESKYVGFLMPLIDKKIAKTLEYFFDYNLSKRLSATTSNVLSFKIEILRNLAEQIEKLHEKNHRFVDLKPQNVGVFEGTNIVTLLDCDGFWIHNETNNHDYQSTMVSPDYICPELYYSTNINEKKIQGQDEYAFAVIAFQMLNNGIHPFQGIILDKTVNITQNDEAAANGLYAYGIKPSDKIKPKPQSIHETFLAKTRELFDKAFTSQSRPKLREWREHFAQILNEKELVRCSEKPTDPNHIHFRGMACPLCNSNENRSANETNISTIRGFSDIASHYGVGNNQNIVIQNSSNPLLKTGMYVFAFFVIISGISYYQDSSIANLEICNKTTEIVHVAISSIKKEVQTITGWYKYTPNECAKFKLNKENLSFFAESKTAKWAGNDNKYNYCVDAKNAFELSARDYCAVGEKLEKFKPINFAGTKYTLDLISK